MNLTALTRRAGKLLCLGACVWLAACSSPSRPKPADIAPVAVQQDVRTLWTSQIGDIKFPLEVSIRDNRLAVANSKGEVAMLDAQSGRDIWRLNLQQPVAAGVGTDGQQAALITRDNQLVVLAEGRVLWRQALTAESFTAPLVAGGRVFVLGADRSVTAFDGTSGRKLWTQQRAGEPLVLKQTGVLSAFKNTLLVGWSGRLIGLNPDNGLVRWESVVATTRGTNDMERLIDLLGPINRVGDTVCARAFQAQIGCVDAERGQVLWSRASNGNQAIGGDAQLVVAPLANGVVQAWRRSNGDRLWETERLKYRILSAPLVTSRGVLVADSGGWLYVLSLADGALLNRISLGSDELAAAPVASDAAVVVVSRNGRVTGLQLP